MKSLHSLLCSHNLPFLISCSFFPSSLLFSSTWLNHLVLGHPTDLFRLHFNPNAVLRMLVLLMSSNCRLEAQYREHIFIRMGHCVG